MFMWKLSIFRRKRPGFALVFTVLIALAMIIPVMILASSSITRRKAVSGESVSDRVLSVADATVDMIVNKINELPEEVKTDPVIKQGIDNINKFYNDHYYSSGNTPNPANEPNKVTVKYATAYLLSKINGGVPYQPDGTSDPAAGVGADYDSYKDASFTEGDGSLWDIEDNVATYLYDLKSQEYYVVVTTDGDGKYTIPAYSGDVGFDHVKKLQELEVENADKKLSEWDSNYEKDNRWIESDVSVEYVDNGENQDQSAKFRIRVTSYLISDKENISNLQRSVVAEVGLKTLDIDTSSGSGGSGGSGGSSGGSDFPAAFKHAVWSGGDTTVNGDITFAAADINPDGSYTQREEGGDLYGAQDITLNGWVDVNGNVITGRPKDGGTFGDPIIINGMVNIKQGKIYGEEEDLPDFDTDTEDNVKTEATVQSSPFSYGYSGISTISNYDIVVNGIQTSYYIGGDADLNAEGEIHFNTSNSDPPVDWYVDGDLTFNGITDIYIDKPGYIWVNGDIIFNGIVRIHGPVTFVSNSKVIFNGDGRIKYSNNQDMVVIISEGEGFDGGIIVNGYGEYDGIFYAPHSSITFNGETTVFGTVVGGGSSWDQGVVMNGNCNFIFDTRLAGYNPGGGGGGNSTPPLPGTTSSHSEITGVHYNSKTVYRLSWKEMISDPVTPENIKNICKKDKPDGVYYIFSGSTS